MTIEKYARRPKNGLIDQKGKYEIFNLETNPFPSSPFVNPDSTDARSNGKIYETSIREKEYKAIEENFLNVPQSDSNHLRLGYIMDTSYIGRGNGKTAFLTNLQKKINKDFGFSISNGANRCFAVTVVPEPSGKTKTFDNFVDLFANKIFDSNIIEDCLVSLRLNAVSDLYDDFNAEEHFPDEESIKNKLQSPNWYKENSIDFRSVTQQILSSVYLQSLPSDFPLYSSNSLVFLTVTKQEDFIEYYRNLKRGTPRNEFIFSHLVNFFLASGFNGAYTFIDDFERIPDFQSERQKRDFAVELRTCLFDGLSTNAKFGFYNFLIVLHAGVPPMIQSAWEQAGLEHRSPIFFKGTSKNVIRFEKIRVEDALSLVQKYLQYYRISDVGTNNFFPFTKEAVSKIAELNDFNASKILKMAYEILERAAEQNAPKIDVEFIQSIDEAQLAEQPGASGISEATTKDLMKEA